MSRRSAALAGVIVVGSAGLARADIDIERADALFAEGLALRDKDLASACSKFRESLQLNPQAIGTLLNVALCDQRQGRIASAVAKFSEARDRATEQQLPEYIAAAQEHIDKLLPDLPHVTVKLADRLPDMQVLVDERVIAPDKLEQIAVDPGDHVITVTAPGRLPFKRTVTVAIRGRETIEVPTLARSVTVAKVVKSSRRTIGKVTVASGAGITTAAVVLGLVARGRYNAQFDSGACELRDGERVCTPDGFDATTRARTYGTVGSIAGVVGAGTIAVGAYLWVTAPTSSVETRVGIVPQVTGDSLGVLAFGRF